MLDISSLYCGASNDGDTLRYGRKRKNRDNHLKPSHGSKRKPVVVMNITRNCNLKCVHCYAGSKPGYYPGQLTVAEIKEVLRDLKEYGVPAVLFSGGEPLVHPRFFELLKYAGELGLRTTLSTNGTLIDKRIARKLAESDLRYVGISLDGMKEVNDQVRGKSGAFKRSVRGIRNCIEVGQKVGLRMTFTRFNYRDLDQIFDFIEREGIRRVCFYHLAYSGRGKQIKSADLTGDQTRRVLDKIIRKTRQFHDEGKDIEILTVANPVDNVYLYKKILEEDPDQADEARRQLEWNGGALNSSGIGLASIDFYGRVHPNQFWMNRSLGNVKLRPFSEIWEDDSNEFLHKLRNRSDYLESECVDCSFFKMCGGGLRVRAESSGNLWGRDPACYLNSAERADESLLVSN